ncbi:MAG: hypothetical protein OEN21_12810 [Myxococcales bacterium]|nr:hypothetical protein [Myxococcales bacterium]
MERLALFLVGSTVIAMTIGCSEESGGGGAGSGGAGGIAGTGGMTGTGGAAGMGGSGMVQLSVTVTEAPSLDDELFNGAPFEGVDLCDADTTNCATADAQGLAQITLPANQEVTYTVSKDGYVPYVVGDVSDPPALASTWPMISDALMAAEGERVGFAWPPDSEGLVALAVVPNRAGVTWEIDDGAATVYYMDEDAVAQLGLTATTNAGRGGFYDVSVGVREVDYSGTITTCTPGIAWPGSAANQIRVPARATHISYGSMNCDEP